MMRKIIVLFASLLFLFVVAACANNANNTNNKSAGFATITDDNGRVIALEKKPEKIIVTSASFIEPLYAVGGKVIGRPDSKMEIPDEAKQAKVIGKVYQIDTEALLSLTPDLVIINKGKNEKLIEPLEASGVKTIVVEMKTYEDVKRTLKLFGTLAGGEKKADEIISDMDMEIAKIKEKMPKTSLNIAILHGTSQSVTLELKDSIAGNVANILGLKNIADGMKALPNNPAAAPYSLETLAEKNPDIIFVTTMGKAKEIETEMMKSMEENPAWLTIGAVKNKKVFFLTQDHFLFCPGIHYANAIEEMADKIK